MSTFGSSDREIANATVYIKDDKYIASIYGVQPYRVARLRKERAKKNGALIGLPKGSDPKNSNVGSDSELLHRNSMEEGSARLLDALLTYLRERERRVSRL